MAHQPWCAQDLEQSIPARFEQVALQQPEAIALQSADNALTYDALNRYANRLAHTLLELTGLESEPTALLFDQGIQSTVATLGTLKAGKFYVPLDTRAPLPLLQNQLSAAKARLLVTDAEHRELAEQLRSPDTTIVAVDQSTLAETESSPSIVATPEQLAYLFFTSGSTGTPKAVMDSHRNVMHNVLRYTNHLQVHSADRLSLIQSPAFSATVSSLFTGLLNGATVCPFNHSRIGTEALAEFVNDLGITIFHSVPAIFRVLVLCQPRFPGVRVVRLEGDVTRPADVDLFRTHFSESCQLAVGLGATETGLSCQYLVPKRARFASGRVPLGYPTADMTLTISDPHGNPVPQGSAGELIVHSHYLALGYWQRPDLTRSLFSEPTDRGDMRSYRTGDRCRVNAQGHLEYLGRNAGCPKINGHWVEPADIEAALLQLEGIDQAAVTVAEQPGKDPELIAQIVFEPSRSQPLPKIRQQLAQQIPRAVIPGRIIAVEQLPLSLNGKVNPAAIR